MSEFNNRITAQRNALKIINGSGLFSEPLLSLTEKAIDRWSNNNGVNTYDSTVSLLKLISGTLFFLANKSQEQITEDYKALSEKVNNQLSELDLEIKDKILQLKNR
ncbi:hypothetical protein PZA20_07745 [Pectobacterium polaris]|uniref:hypothetical protein n=1 Tax=Pectobacterium polaris TaxID=2042057 RepID=UPI0023B1869E|nr:hypothetical protein [Pectobacterium polaris]MDE8741717.1 hypothetical protein [Pectobacterium polaris]